ncbi:V-type ATP synthase subunit I [Desulfurococcus amylolyticus]|uniref:V-type ATP synthase subunit I n=1 Tax=Desulfurococcus amylolyticus TaxID=94694 RepID=UPI0023F0A926|nr:V-type ATPase 116kDa subunit family protein [Desulfurococcus amylolyticus]
MGLLLSKPSEMVKINAAFLQADKEKALRLLQEAGVIDIEPVEAEKIVREYERLQSLRERINSLIQKAKGLAINVSITGLELSSIEISRIEKDVASLQDEVALLEGKLKHVRETLDSLKMLQTAINPLPDTMETTEIYYEGRHLSSILLTGKRETINELVEKPGLIKAAHSFKIDEEQVSIIVYVSSQDLNQLLSLASSMGIWYPGRQLLEFIQPHKSIGLLKEYLGKKITELSEEDESLEGKIVEKIKSHGEILGKYLLIVENYIEYYKVSGITTDLKHLSAVTGWLPRDAVRILEDLIRKINIPILIEYRDPVRGVDNPPTKFNNKGVIRYFQLVTRLYGVPSYWEHDPTPLIMYSFAFFFGIMNADAGYALAGFISILLIMDKLVENPYSNAYKEFKGLLIVSNIISLVLGLLSGSFFGDLLPSILNINIPAILTVFSQPVEFIKLALLIGLIHINIAHVLATMKFIRERRRGDLLNEVGLFISELFGIPYVLKVFFRYEVPFLTLIPEKILLYLALLGVVIVIVGNYLSMRGLGFLMWIFQLTGILGDVMSYVRLAGVSLASFYMASSFNIMVKLVINGLTTIIPGVAGTMIAYIVSAPLLLLIHLLVMVLSQMGAFVHSLRLCMLEFLMKFYDGSGREYNPFSIVAFKRIVVS